MALTYTEIEQQKNRRIFFFFTVVLLFYFLTAFILATVTKLFFRTEFGIKGSSPFLTGEETFLIFMFSLFAALVHLLYSISHVTSFVKRALGVVNLDSSDTYHQRFKTIVDEVNVATGSRYTIAPVVVPTVAMNAFTISHNNREALLGITEGLLSRLNRQQLQGVVAHEVAHIVSGDSFQTTVGCALFGVYAALLSGIEKTFRGGIRASGRGGAGLILFLCLIYVLLQVLQFFYNLVRLFVSRDREFRADAIAVRLTRDPISLSEALYMISRGWRGLGFIDRNLESLFIMNPVHEELDESEGTWADLLSTHPPIRKRMEILSQMAHADVKAVQESVLRQEKLQESLREPVRDEQGPRWMAFEEEKGWAGPFTLTQLIHLGWVKPETWLKAVEEERIKQAKEEIFLKPYFEEQIRKPNVSSFSCPRCNQSLVEEVYEGVVTYRCVFCGGIFVEEEKVGRIIIRKEVDFDERIKRLAELTQRQGLEKIKAKNREKVLFYLKCPRCGEEMMRNFYTLAYLVTVDRCISCGFVWLDQDELEMIQYLVENVKAI